MKKFLKIIINVPQKNFTAQYTSVTPVDKKIKNILPSHVNITNF